MQSKLERVTAAEEAAIRQLDEAALTTLIVELGLAFDGEQLRAAVARASTSAAADGWPPAS
jgi:hypothetical protein